MSKSVFGGINISDKRGPNEPFDKYKNRLRNNRVLVRRYLFGRFVWDGRWGTAHKKDIK